MKTKLTRLMSLLMAAAVVLSLAACGGKGDEPDTSGAAQGNAAPNASDTVAPADDESTEPSESGTNTDSTKPTDKADDSTKPSDKTEATDPKKPADKPQKPDDNASKAPSGVNGIVSYYNAAVKKISKVSGTTSRNLTSGRASDIPSFIVKDGFLDLTEKDTKKVIDQTNIALNSSRAKLQALSASDVSNAACKESGNNYVLTISLKNKSGTDDNIKLGAGGYMYFADMEDLKTAVIAVGGVLGVPGELSVKTATMNLSNGKLEVTVNKSTGKISKATLSLKEDITATASYIVKIPVTLGATITTNYTAS